MRFEAEGTTVFVIVDGHKNVLCEVSKELLAPEHNASLIAQAMNAKFDIT